MGRDGGGRVMEPQAAGLIPESAIRGQGDMSHSWALVGPKSEMVGPRIGSGGLTRSGRGRGAAVKKGKSVI